MPFLVGRAGWTGLEESALLCILGGSRGDLEGPLPRQAVGGTGSRGVLVTLAGPTVQAGW